MPTGYTAGIVDGTETPERFMVNTLRAMGVAIMQRDEPMDNPVRRRQPEQYYINAVKDDQVKLEELLNRSENDWKAAYVEAVKENAERKAKDKVQKEIENSRLDRTQEFVESKEYSADLIGWKDFMLDQINISRPYPLREESYHVGTFEDFVADSINSAKRSLEISQEGLARDKEIVESNNAWLDKAAKVLGIEIND